MMREAMTVYLDVSGVCNATCPYCLSGRYKVPGGKFINVDVFEQILKRLTELKIVDNLSVLALYNWGEPFLHPRLGELVAITNRFEIPYAFSTNASVIPSIDRSFVNGLKMIIFSMPGFSQSSYDRIHGFGFQTICKNIETIIDRSHSVGYKGAFRIHYHVYQFNMSEIAQCEEFSRHLGIDLELHYAILNHWDHLWAYVDNELPYSMLKEVSQDLFCFRLRQLIPESVESYRCPQYDLLAIDENADVPLCCQVPKGDQYVAGNILHDDIEDIQRKRMHNDTCTRCIERGMARYLNTSLEFPFLRRQNRPDLAQRLYRKIRNHFG
jgi:MoaA/NifB/PqqE/SkfB family radical SAM enzyme